MHHFAGMPLTRRGKIWWSGVVLACAAAGLAGYLTSHHQSAPAIQGYPVLVPQAAGPADSATIQGTWVWPPDQHGSESYWDLRQEGPVVHGAYRWNTSSDVHEVEGRVSATGAVVLRDVSTSPGPRARYEGQLASGIIRGVQIVGDKRYVWSLRPGAWPNAIAMPPVQGEPAYLSSRYSRAADSTEFNEYLVEQRSDDAADQGDDEADTRVLSDSTDHGLDDHADRDTYAGTAAALNGTWRGVMRDHDDRGQVTMDLRGTGADVGGTATIANPTTGDESNLDFSGHYENGRLSGFLTGRVDTCNVHLIIHATVRGDRQVGSFSGTNSCSPSGYAGTLELTRQ